MADLLAWILEQQGVSNLLHYLDDFLTMGHPHSPERQHNLHTLIQVCHLLNVPLATQKVEGSTPCLDFLGIILDTICMETRLPEEKITRIFHAVDNWLDKRNATKREILSLVGLLQHAAKVVRPGRIFVRRMYNVAAKVQEVDYYTQQRIPLRSILAAYFCNQLERDQFSPGGIRQLYPTSNHTNRRIGYMGMWGIFRRKVAPIAMDTGMALHTDNGKRDGANSSKLCSVGASAIL